MTTTNLRAALLSVEDHLSALLNLAPALPVEAKAAAKAAAAKRRGIGPVALRLVAEGKTNLEVLVALRNRFGLDVPASYPAWYRGDAIRRGLVTKEFAKSHA